MKMRGRLPLCVGDLLIAENSAEQGTTHDQRGQFERGDIILVLRLTRGQDYIVTILTPNGLCRVYDFWAENLQKLHSE